MFIYNEPQNTDSVFIFSFHNPITQFSLSCLICVTLLYNIMLNVLILMRALKHLQYLCMEYTLRCKSREFSSIYYERHISISVKTRNRFVLKDLEYIYFHAMLLKDILFDFSIQMSSLDMENSPKLRWCEILICRKLLQIHLLVLYTFKI